MCRMRLSIHDWMDDWFLSLSESPDRLDKAINNYQTARMGGMFCLVMILGIFLFAIFKSPGTFAGNGFMFSLVVFMLVLVVETDVFTKVLKLQRQQQNRAMKDAKRPSGLDKKTPYL